MYTPDYVKQNDPERDPQYRPVGGSGGATWIVAIVLVVGLGLLLTVSMYTADGTDSSATMPATDAPAATEIAPDGQDAAGAPALNETAPAEPAVPAQ